MSSPTSERNAADSRTEALCAEIAAAGAESAGMLSLFILNPGTHGSTVPAGSCVAHVVTERALPGPASNGMRVSVQPGVVPVGVVETDDFRCEVMYWLDSQIELLAAKVTAERFAAGAAASPLLRAEEQVLEAVLAAAPVRGADWLTDRRRTLTESAFGEFALVRSLGDAEGSMEDTRGQLAAEDWHSAVLSARKAFNHTVDALLENYGFFGTYEHHRRAQRFRAAAPAELSFERFWALETMAGLDPNCPANWADEVLQVCEDITATLPPDLVAQSVRGPRRGW